MQKCYVLGGRRAIFNYIHTTPCLRDDGSRVLPKQSTYIEMVMPMVWGSIHDPTNKSFLARRRLRAYWSHNMDGGAGSCITMPMRPRSFLLIIIILRPSPKQNSFAKATAAARLLCNLIVVCECVCIIRNIWETRTQERPRHNIPPLQTTFSSSPLGELYFVG